MNRAVFLDRDGVVNQSIVRDGKPYAPRTLDAFILNPEIQELARLRNLGYKLIIVTNQPDVANGLVVRDVVEAMHRRLYETFPFDDIMACFHNAQDGCDCRKPKPGMLHQARDKFGLDLAGSFMVGDRWRDVEAGQAAGCTTVFLDYGYKEESPAQPPDFVCASLTAVVAWIEGKNGTAE